MNKYQQDFINNLKYFRKAKKISQEKLAEKCSVSTGTIGNIECGLAKPSFELILKIADILGIHPASLFTRDYNQNQSLIKKDDSFELNKIYLELQNYFNKKD